MAVIALIPAYDPDVKLIELVDQLKENAFDIVIVNDGSGPEYAGIFDKCREKATVIGYEENSGKGYALKFGMTYILLNCPGSEGFVTADADGQHSVKDICRVRDEIKAGAEFVITVRNLHRKAPFLSRIGNGLSRFMFAIANARYLPDNQSGLRGFASRHIEWMLKVSGFKYDYELNVLLVAEKQGIKLTKVPIETIYFDNNSGSHFKPVKDTLRIYKTYFQTNIFVLISCAIELILVILATIFLGYNYFVFVIMICFGIHYLLCMVVERFTLFRWVRYRPGFRRLVIAIIKYSVNTLFCFAAQYIKMPFAVAFVIAAMIIAVGEFYALKATYDQ